jgi:hypothetical protein
MKTFDIAAFPMELFAGHSPEFPTAYMKKISVAGGR